MSTCVSSISCCWVLLTPKARINLHVVIIHNDKFDDNAAVKAVLWLDDMLQLGQSHSVYDVDPINVVASEVGLLEAATPCTGRHFVLRRSSFVSGSLVVWRRGGREKGALESI